MDTSLVRLWQAAEYVSALHPGKKRLHVRSTDGREAAV